MQTKLLIFDLDGTLIDSEEANFHAYATALKEAGFELEREFFAANCFNGQHYTQFLPQIMPNCSEEQIKQVHDRKQIIYAEHLQMIRLHPYLNMLIRQNPYKLSVALGTGAARIAVQNVLAAIELENVFDYIVTGDDVAAKKPHPECFLKIMEYFQESPEATVIFEDSAIGLEAARKTGAWVMKVEQWAEGENYVDNCSSVL